MCRYKEDQQREVLEAAEKAKLASMTDEERRRWELENPKVTKRHDVSTVSSNTCLTVNVRNSCSGAYSLLHQSTHFPVHPLPHHVAIRGATMNLPALEPPCLGTC